MNIEQQRALAIAQAKRRRAESEQNDFASRAASMDPTDLSVARSKNDAFGEYLRSEAQKPREGETEQARNERLYGKISDPGMDVGTGEGMLRGYVQGGMFGGGDEAVAAGTAALDALINGNDFGDAYDVRVARERGKIDRFRKDNPVAAYGSEFVGAVPTSIMAGPQGVANTLRGRLAQGVLTGAGQGGIYGFNADEGGAIDRMDGAGMGAGLGGLVGGLSVPVSSMVGKLANRLATGRAANQTGMSRPAYEIMRQASEADDSLTGAGARRIAAAGDDAMLADAGPSQRALLDVAVQRTGPASRVATERVGARVDRAGQKVNQVLDDVLGKPQGVRSAARDISQSTSGARGDAYRAAYSQPINYADETGRAIEGALGRIPPRVMNDAVRKANERMQAEGVRNNQILLNVADDGSVTLREMPNVMQLDYIKRALGELGAEADQFGRQAAGADMYSGLARQLKNAISDAVPGYKEAVRLGGDKIERDNALRLGRDLLRPNVTREVVAEMAEDMSDEARTAALNGLRGAIDDTLANVKRTMTDPNVDAREVYKLITDMSSRANREKAAMIVGDEAAGRLFSQLDEAAMAFELRAGVAQNSKTFARNALNDVVEDTVNSGPVAALRDGDPVGSARNLAQALLGGGPEAKKKVTDKVVSELVDILTAPNPMEQLQRLQSLPGRVDASTQTARNLAARLLQRNVPVTAPVVQGFSGQ